MVRTVNQIVELIKKDPKLKDQVLVAEGDSWFSDPRMNVLEVLGRSYPVVEVASTGDTLEEMAYSADQIDELIGCLRNLNGNNITPKAILFSGGGNDFVSALETILNYNQPNLQNHEVLNKKIIKEVIDIRLKNAYKELINCVTCESDELFESPIPILIHGYDHPIPDGREVDLDGLAGEVVEQIKKIFRLLKGKPWHGPWLKPAFEKMGYNNLQDNTATMKKMNNRFNYMLKQLAKKFCHVTHVDVRRRLSNSLNDYKKVWEDELHPTQEGYRLVAEKFHEEIQNLAQTE